MPKFLDNIEFYTEGYNTESLTINKETKPISLNEDWNKETVNLEIPSTTITYPAEDPAKKRITDISRDIKKEKDEAIYKIEELSKSGLNGTNKLVQKGLNALNDKTQEGLTKINGAGTNWSETLGIDAFVNFRDSHNNIENGTGDVLVQTTDSNHSFKVMTDGRAKVYGTPKDDNDVTRRVDLIAKPVTETETIIVDTTTVSFALDTEHDTGMYVSAENAISLGSTQGWDSGRAKYKVIWDGVEYIVYGQCSNVTKMTDLRPTGYYGWQLLGNGSNAKLMMYNKDTLDIPFAITQDRWKNAGEWLVYATTSTAATHTIKVIKVEGTYDKITPEYQYGYLSLVSQNKQNAFIYGTNSIPDRFDGFVAAPGNTVVIDDASKGVSNCIITADGSYVNVSSANGQLRSPAITGSFNSLYISGLLQSPLLAGYSNQIKNNGASWLAPFVAGYKNNVTADKGTIHPDAVFGSSNEVTYSGNSSYGLNLITGNTHNVKNVSLSLVAGLANRVECLTADNYIGANLVGGQQNVVNHSRVVMGGARNKSDRNNQFVAGIYSAPNEKALLKIGNGTSDADKDRKNAFEVLEDGRATIQTAPQYTNDVANKGYVDDGWNKFNLENGEGKTALQQKRDASYTGIAIKTKNPNAYTLDNTLTDNEPIGGTGDYASSFGGASSAQGKRSLAEGTNTVAKGRYSHAEGCNSVTLGDDSHAEGGLTVAGAIAAHSEGWETQAVEEYSHAEGYRTIAAGSGSHAEGGMTYANAKYSHTEGVGNKSSTVLPEQGGGGGGTEPPPTESESPDELLGAYAHVEGIFNTVYGYGSHAEGQGNIVYGHRSHAEGRNTVAGRIDSYADGSRKVAGECIHTEGVNTVASGDYSHAEGANTKAIGAYSHAAGANTEAHRAYSTAIGFYTTTEGGANCSLVTGKYNIKGYSNALFAVGNGSSDTDRKNAFTVLEDGRAKIQTTPSEIDDVVNKGYVDGSGMQGTGDPPLQGYNKNKGTIEERLTNLGFKELQTYIKESIVVSGATYNGPIGSITLQSVNTYRQGNMARLSLSISFSSQILNLRKDSQFYEFYFNSAEAGVPGIIPENYRPTSDYIFTAYSRINVELRGGTDQLITRIVCAIPIRCTVKTSGAITLQIYTPLTASTSSGVIDDSKTRRGIAGQSQVLYIGYPVRPYVSE